MEWHGLHRGPPKIRLVPGKVKKSTGKKQSTNPTVVSAIIDVQVSGAEIWQAGKFREFVEKTTFDKKLGYPLGMITEADDSPLANEEPFDDPNKNPLEHESYEDVHGDKSDESGLGSLGGGNMYSTGQII